jgi:small ligand-binding sensory domain FIST
LQETVAELSEGDRQLAQHSLFLGLVNDEFFKQEVGPGDYLIRNILGGDPQTGAIAIGDRLRPGQRVQWHLRDARASAEDLKAVLRRYRQAQPQAPTAAVLFSCLGRGEGLYQEPNHDSRVFGAEIGTIPLGGFFCNGEIGPVGTTTFLHGYTSAFGLLRAR